MKKLLWFCVALLVVPASTAFAQIDLTWDNCTIAMGAEPAPQTDKSFLCNGAVTSKLVGSFKVPQSIPDFVAMDVSIDLQQSDNNPLVPFYHYEGAGCNNSGLGVSDAKNASGGCAAFSTAWAINGSQATEAITGYGPNFMGQNGRGRLLVTIARPFDQPTALNAGTNYYAFHLNFDDFNAPGAGGNNCNGCNQPASIVWNSATMFGVTQTQRLAGPTPKSSQYCATIAQGISTCAATPTRNSTWGQLKSIYR